MQSLSYLKESLQLPVTLNQTAWHLIKESLKFIELDQEEVLPYNQKVFMFVASGVLIEYDTYLRKKPTIVNFTGNSKCVVTNKNKPNRYFKSCGKTTIYLLDCHKLLETYNQFKELKNIYNILSERHEEALNFRTYILETTFSKMRISLFKEHFEAEYPYLKKKDIANYLQLNYVHFLHVHAQLLRGG